MATKVIESTNREDFLRAAKVQKRCVRLSFQAVMWVNPLDGKAIKFTWEEIDAERVTKFE